jgi:hypothetical protein
MGNLKYGRLAPHPVSTHPRVYFENYLDSAQLPQAPSVVDVASKVSSWPMYYNDQLGDCTCAAAGHVIQALTAYSSSEVTLPEFNRRKESLTKVLTNQSGCDRVSSSWSGDVSGQATVCQTKSPLIGL